MRLMTGLKFIPLALFFISLFYSRVFAYNFHEAIDSLDRHPTVKASQAQKLLFKEQGRWEGAWGRPVLKVSAHNLIGEEPAVSSMASAVAMKHIEVQLAQKVPLTSVYKTRRKAYQALTESQKYKTQGQKRKLMRDLWIALITKRHIAEEIQILKENLDWIAKNIAVSEKLYTSGAIPQQALLTLQMRKAEIETDLKTKQIAIQQQNDQWQYLVDLPGSLEESSIPWDFLSTKTTRSDLIDPQQQALNRQIQAKSLKARAAKQAFIPEVTFGVSYTRMTRSREDFISAGVSLPLPFSQKPFAMHAASELEKQIAIENLHDYQRSKQLQKQQLTRNMEKHTIELQILNQQTIKFAQSAKSITSQSYSFGQVDYKTLLEAELRLQKLLLQRSWLKAQLAKNQISYKYLIGDDLYAKIEVK